MSSTSPPSAAVHPVVEDAGITVIENIPLGSIVLVPKAGTVFRVKTHLVKQRLVLLYPALLLSGSQSGYPENCLEYPYGTHVRFVGNSTKGHVWDLLQHDTDRLTSPAKSEPQ